MANLVLLGELFTDNEVPGTILYAGLLKQYGHAIFEWDVETLELEIKDDFDVDITDNNLDKVQAVITALTTDKFYTDYKVFEAVCSALNDDAVEPERINEVPPEQMAWAITELAELDDKPVEWDEDIKSYIRKVLEDYGFISPPTALAFCNFKDVSVDSLGLPDELKEKVQLDQTIKINRVTAYVLSRQKLVEKYKAYL